MEFEPDIDGPFFHYHFFRAGCGFARGYFTYRQARLATRGVCFPGSSLTPLDHLSPLTQGFIRATRYQSSHDRR